MLELPSLVETAYVNAQIENGHCCAIVGLSNTGKSTMLRSLQPTAGGALLFYVDCNRMLELSEQGFSEAVLRVIRSRLREFDLPDELAVRIDESYRQVIEPRTPLAIALGFSDAMERLCDAGRRIVLILDEFDEPFEALAGRIFLNLRALRDRYREQLVLITGTVRALEEIRDDDETVEFRELFAGRVCHIGMLDPAAARAALAALLDKQQATMSAAEHDFVLCAAGGHPGILQAVLRLLLHARSVAPQTYEKMGVQLVADALLGDPVVRGECERLWSQLTAGERHGLRTIDRGESPNAAENEWLQRLGLLDERQCIFGTAFAAFVARRGEQRAGIPPGVWIDEEAGQVYVNGRQAPTLTDLEYRLLSVLYERQDKLCDKYLLVEQVWGESYIDQVDDARVEKLVSRVRAKVEEEPANPTYLVTVRGRGYCLSSHPEAGHKAN